MSPLDRIRTYSRKTAVAFVHDLCWVPVAMLLAYWVRFNLAGIPQPYWSGLMLMLTVAAPIQAVVFWRFGLYRGLWRFASMADLRRILQSVGLGALLTVLVVFVLQRMEGVPRSVLLLYPLFLSLGLAMPRLLYRLLKERRLQVGGGRTRALIVGAGRAGELLVRDLLKGGSYVPVGFLDDDPDKQNKEIHGVPVLAPLSGLAEQIRRRDVDIVMFAMPSARPAVWRQLVQVCSDLHVPFRTLPSPSELADGRVEVSRLRSVRIEDLLGREPVTPDRALLARCIRSKTVMVTGAGGSIGSELCRQIVHEKPAAMILFEKNEYALYRIEQELLALKDTRSVEIVPVLGSVHHRNRVERVCRTFAVQTIYHAAAYKHVPIVESNPIEAVHNNIFGTLHAAQAAIAAGVETFVLISTDKAVRPTNVMGATKRFAELVLQGLNGLEGSRGTRLCMVRFGNVIGSSGSVVPLFRKQIRDGGPVTVTHPEVTRFFMTIPEAAQLVIQAGAMCRGGDVFVLDMGMPVRISELAQRMIQLSGLTVRDAEHPDGDIEIRYTGLRPGEKLYEELLVGERVSGTEHPLIMRADEASLPWPEVAGLLQRLEEASRTFDYQLVRQLLQEAVVGYQPQCGIRDHVWLRSGRASQGKVTKLAVQRTER